MKLFLILFLAISINSYSQHINFQNYYSFYHYAEGNDLIISSDGFYLLVGFTYYHNGPRSPFLYKIDMNGNVIWGHLSNNQGSDNPGFVIETKSNRYLTVENVGVWSLLKMFDTSGTQLWETPSHNGQIYSALEIADNIYCMGEYENSSQQTFGFILKTNDFGDTLSYIDQLPYDFGYLFGNYKSSFCTFNNNIAFCSYNYDTLTGDYTPKLTMIDTMAIQIWTKTYPSAIDCLGKSVIVNNSGEFVILTEGRNRLLKTDSTGNLIWQKFLISGYNFELLNGYNNEIIVGSQEYLNTYDSSGTILDSISFSTIPEICALAVTDSTFAFAGSDFLSSYLNSYIIQFRDTSYITIFENIDNFKLTLYPNPFQSYIEIKSMEHTKGRIQVADINGRILIDQNFSGNTKLNTDHLSDGLYTVIVNSNQNVIRRKMIKIR